MADAQDGVLALLDILHQLNGGSKALLHIVADVAVGGVARQQAAIRGAQAELRHVIIIDENLPLTIDFAELNIGLDKPRFGFVVAQARLRIETLDHVHGALHHFHRTVQRARDFLQLVILQKLQMFGDDLLRQGVLRVKHFHLQDQAFLQIARADSGRIEFLDHGQRFFDILHGIISRLRDFIQRRGQVSVFIQIADDRFGDLAQRLGANADAHLPGQVIGKTRGRREKLVERRSSRFLRARRRRRAPRRYRDIG